MKYAIVTGASPSSIGFLAAKKLAATSNDLKVILACRNEEKGQQAQRLIQTEYPSSRPLFMLLDLASFDSIRKFVDDVHTLDDGAIAKDCGLSILIDNAGIGWGKDTPYIETNDGLEEIVGVNHFGTFLLTQLLLEDLKRAEGQSRVVIVSSSLHDPNSWKDKKTESNEPALVLPDFPEGIVQSKEGYDGFQAYKVSKLCNLWYAYELQRRLDQDRDSIKVNAVSPGFIPTTGLTRRSGWLGVFFLHYILDPLRYFGIGITRSPDEGAEALFQVCTSDIASKGGEYFQLPKGKDVIEAIPSSAESMDENKAKQLWNISIEKCKL
ncbi:short chain dehydrogenase [Nitzschia inconspicua]|uniref:Short chain dehydrogenase n=1 Tax=Nitzschia inconspicua TaxID=303405 RepID=A0A9K3KRA7_9STRA|nr:short chain dehydrogenase [Nitzschia inconspicua]